MEHSKVIHINEFTLKEYNLIRDILIEWGYEWLEYDILHDSNEEKVRLTFYLEEEIMDLGEFAHLMFCLGEEIVFRR